MKRTHSTFCRAFGSLLLVGAVFGQSEEELQFIEAAESGGDWTLTIVVMLLAGLGLAYFLRRKARAGKPETNYNYAARYQPTTTANSTSAPENVDADREIEWLRKIKKTPAKPAAISFTPKKVPQPEQSTPAMDDLNFETKAFQERMRKLQYAQLPVNSFYDLAPASSIDALPLSNDESLLSAIEQANEEFEEDESVRELALRVLARFRTRNSVEALTQIALYDLSSNLRSKAVASLTEFDHESVFEAILLANADPTREVRAAAARGLFRLNFDRADAWKRIIEADDEFRMTHCARAAMEAGIVVKSFDRLVHEDQKIAYEAFALVMLLVKAGETAEIFEAIENHKDERVKFALLHALKVTRDERTLERLQQMLTGSIPTDVADRVKDAVASFEPVMA